MTVQPPDEMVDGRRGVRPQWRGVLGALAGVDLAERGRRLDRAFEEEGVGGWLPGARQAWRCDPVPLVLPGAEFAALEAGLAQRARLWQAVLADLYGARRLLAEGVLPPALVFANPGFLRAAPWGAPWGAPVLSFYAADLVRGADGCWRVLADRVAEAGGIAQARENRRLVSRVLPELSRPVQVRQLRPFFDRWQDALRRLGGAGTVALLTPGTGSARWFEHMYLSRELGCALVEGGDLTVRGDAVFLKTLKGLQPVDVILSKVPGRMLDPLELEAGQHLGVPGLLGAMRAGRVRVANDPGAAVLEAPGLAGFVPALMARLLGEAPAIEGVEALWLGAPGAREAVMRAPACWVLRPAAEGGGAGVRAGDPAAPWPEVAARPWAWVAQAAVPGSLAPALEGDGLQPRPVVLRVFLACDGAGWQAMQGGLAEVLPEGALPGLPRAGERRTKDVWVLREDSLDIVGPAPRPAPPLVLRRASGDLPSRVADNLFWLGRYVERLDRAARLVRAALVRLNRGAAMLPREGMELAVLARSLAAAGLVGKEVATKEEAGAVLPMSLGAALREALREGGSVGRLFAQVAALAANVRDRLTSDMYATFTQARRAARDEAAAAAQAGDLDRIGHAMASVARFASAVAGLAAENMVRGGGWLFLDLGRRMERAQAVATEVGFAIDQPPARIEPGLLLALELCDSAITYRSRYFNVVQAAPVLDLVLADQGNPRGLAFQLVAMHEALDVLDGEAQEGGAGERLAASAAGLLAEAESLVGEVLAAADQASAASLVAGRLAALEEDMAALSDRITRRWFALLPEVQTLGVAASGSPEAAA